MSKVQQFARDDADFIRRVSFLYRSEAVAERLRDIAERVEAAGIAYGPTKRQREREKGSAR